MPNKERYRRERLAEARATAAVTGEYLCEACVTFWKPHEVPLDFQVAEGCPNCLEYCERCGTVKCKGRNGHIEHCL